MSRYFGVRGAIFRKVSWLMLTILMVGLPLSTQAAEAPGALTFIVNDQDTHRPLAGVKITITDRGTRSVRTLETSEQGRFVIEPLDPGLYSVNVTKDGFAAVYVPSVRVV
jgi:hypothetical protein